MVVGYGIDYVMINISDRLYFCYSVQCHLIVSYTMYIVHRAVYIVISSNLSIVYANDDINNTTTSKLNILNDFNIFNDQYKY